MKKVLIFSKFHMAKKLENPGRFSPSVHPVPVYSSNGQRTSNECVGVSLETRKPHFLFLNRVATKNERGVLNNFE